MIKKHMLFILVFITLGFSLWSQTTITIGAGTAAQRYPLGCFFGYERHADLYLASEMTAQGDITALQWYSTIAQPTAIPIKIYFRTTTSTFFSTSTWATQIAGATLAYSGTISNLGAGTWNQINLSPPYFNYSGTSLIVFVETDYGDVNGGVGTGASTGAGCYYSSSTARALAWVANSAPPTSVSAALNNRSNIKITLQPQSPMTYSSSTTTQTGAIMLAGATQQPVIGIQVSTLGTLTPLSVTQLTVNAHGSTNIADISNAKVFYTGTSPTFATTTQFGSTVASPTIANFNITGSQALVQGTNYFWLTYDISSAAPSYNVADGECASITVGGVAHTPTITAPAGNSVIKGPLTGILTIGPGGNYTTFTAAINDLNALGVASGGVTFNVTSGQDFVEDPPAITATGTSANPIIFQKSSTAHAALRPTGTAGTADFGFCLNGSDYITFSGIDVIINSGSAVEYGYYLNGASINGAQHNTIENCTITLNNANISSIGINSTTSGTSTNKNSYNHFYNFAISNVGLGINMVGAGNNVEDYGNEIGILTGGTSTITNVSSGSNMAYGIKAFYQINSDISNISISNVLSTLTWAIGIWTEGDNNVVYVHDNTINGVTGKNVTYGIYMNSGVSDVYNNDISNIASTNNNVVAMQTIGTFNIYGNKIHQIHSTTANMITAFIIEGGFTNNVYNNFVYDLSAPNSTASPSLMGFYILMGVTTNIFNNTVVFSSTTNVANSSSGMFSWLSNPYYIDIRNNILVNNCDVGTGGAGRAAIYWGTGFSNVLNTVTNNLYYAGVPGYQHLIFNDGSDNYETLAQYQALVAPRDAIAFTENPPFVNAVTDPHIQSGLATFVEGNAQPITSPFVLSTDIDNEARSSTHPDLGADEGTFSSMVVAPTNLQVTHSGSNCIVTWDPVSGAGSYCVYYADIPNAPAGSWTLLGTVTVPTYTGPTSSHAQFYKVTAVTGP